jgi:hypothetical protein
MAIENRVGDNVPAQEQIDQVVEQIKAHLEFFKTFCVYLSEAERGSRLTPRTGSDGHFNAVLDLSVQHGQSVPGVPLEGVRRDYQLYQRLAPLAAVIEPLSRLIVDTYRQAGHEYWKGFLAYYGALANAAKYSPEVAQSLKDVVDFMATGPRPRKANEPTSEVELSIKIAELQKTLAEATAQLEALQKK